MKYRFAIFIFALFLIVACGREAVQEHQNKQKPDDPHNPQDGKNVTLLLWGAFWCSNCKRDLPEIQTQLKNQLGDNYSRAKMQLLVPTGLKALHKPTQEIAQQYKETLKLDAEAKVDEWFWKTFNVHFTEAMESVPAAVLLDADGNVIKAFPPGETSFVPQEVVTATVESMK